MFFGSDAVGIPEQACDYGFDLQPAQLDHSVYLDRYVDFAGCDPVEEPIMGDPLAA